MFGSFWREEVRKKIGKMDLVGEGSRFLNQLWDDVAKDCWLVVGSGGGRYVSAGGRYGIGFGYIGVGYY